MAQPRSCACFAQETKPRRFISQIPLADDLKGYRAAQIDVERLVRDPHRAATQFHRLPVFACHQLVVVKPLRWLVRCRLDYIVGSRRLAGLNPAKTLAKHAHRTEFHCSGKLVAATQTGSLGLRAHGRNRPSTGESQHHAPPRVLKAASTALGKLLSRCTNNCVFTYSSPSITFRNKIPTRPF